MKKKLGFKRFDNIEEFSKEYGVPEEKLREVIKKHNINVSDEFLGKKNQKEKKASYFTAGFMTKCAEYNVDPDVLIKVAQDSNRNGGGINISAMLPLLLLAGGAYGLSKYRNAKNRHNSAVNTAKLIGGGTGLGLGGAAGFIGGDIISSGMDTIKPFLKNNKLTRFIKGTKLGGKLVAPTKKLLGSNVAKTLGRFGGKYGKLIGLGLGATAGALGIGSIAGRITDNNIRKNHPIYSAVRSIDDKYFG
jgi:hypothetical protein